MDPIIEELERMAQAASAADAQIADEYPSPEAVARWQKLFNYSPMEAVQLISQQRGDLTRTRISNEHWELVRAEREANGYDREAYEHSLRLGNVLKEQSALIPSRNEDGEVVFLFRLGGLLDTPEKVKEITGMDSMPKVAEGHGERGFTNFCLVDMKAKEKIEQWLAQAQVVSKPEEKAS